MLWLVLRAQGRKISKMALGQALTFGVILSVLSVLTVKDLLSTQDKTSVHGQSSFSSNEQHKFAGPAVKFMFWWVFISNILCVPK